LDSTVTNPVRVSEADVERLAGLVGVPISAGELPAVATALGVLLTAAQLVSEFPLPDDVEAAPIFRP
jgi:1-carboxybiuret hydrolase subunit AtzG-like protein